MSDTARASGLPEAGETTMSGRVAAPSGALTGQAGRAVILVGNPAAPYSRALRLARTLVGAGYAVEIAAIAAPGLPDREVGEGWEIRRYRASGAWARLGRSSPAPRAADGAGPGRTAGRSPARRVVARVRGLVATLRRWIFWPHTVRGWWATLARDLEPADLYHACGSLTISAALAARRRAPGRGTAHSPLVIYDAIDDVMESNNVLDMPAPLRTIHERRETRWATSSDGLTTVNEPLADRLGARWGRRPVVVPNYPEVMPYLAAADGIGPLRRELGLPADRPVILFQGRLGPRLGLDEAAEAVLALPDTILVILGFGRGFERERARDSEPRFAGRHVTLPARPPDELLAWTADADVALVPLPPVSVNQRLSSPNKFWEAIAAGTPVVVPASLTYMAELVRSGGLGVVARSASPVDLTAAIGEALAGLAADPAWRDRLRTAASERHSWPVAEASYLGLLRSLDA